MKIDNFFKALAEIIARRNGVEITVKEVVRK